MRHALYDREIEVVSIVCDHEIVAAEVAEIGPYISKPWCFRDHCVGDTVLRRGLTRDRRLRVYERDKSIHDLSVAYAHRSDLDDFCRSSISIGSLNINRGKVDERPGRVSHRYQLDRLKHTERESDRRRIVRGKPNGRRVR